MANELASTAGVPAGGRDSGGSGRLRSAARRRANRARPQQRLTACEVAARSRAASPAQLGRVPAHPRRAARAIGTASPPRTTTSRRARTSSNCSASGTRRRSASWHSAGWRRETGAARRAERYLDAAPATSSRRSARERDLDEAGRAPGRCSTVERRGECAGSPAAMPTTRSCGGWWMRRSSRICWRAKRRPRCSKRPRPTPPSSSSQPPGGDVRVRRLPPGAMRTSRAALARAGAQGSRDYGSGLLADRVARQAITTAPRTLRHRRRRSRLERRGAAPVPDVQPPWRGRASSCAARASGRAQAVDQPTSARSSRCCPGSSAPAPR